MILEASLVDPKAMTRDTTSSVWKKKKTTWKSDVSRSYVIKNNVSQEDAGDVMTMMDIWTHKEHLWQVLLSSFQVFCLEFLGTNWLILKFIALNK